MSETMRLGDKVAGNYGDVAIEGTLVAFDGSGYVYVQVANPVTIFGRERTELCFAPYERRQLRVVERGPELSDDDVRELPASCVGGAYLRRK